MDAKGVKIIYVKYRDPMLFNHPTEKIYPEDLAKITCEIVNDAGILLNWNEDKEELGHE
jgi:hypothetical protein